MSRKNKKFLTTFGFEMTYVPETDFKQPDAYIGCILPALKYEFDNEYSYNVKMHEDCGALEINTPPLPDLTTMRKIFSDIDTFIRRYPFKVSTPTVGSGGGHIHARLFIRDNPLFIRNLFVDTHFRPYLNWMFNEYCDVDNASPFSMSASFLHNDPKVFLDRDVYQFYERFCVQKSFILRYDSVQKTVEFRFFDMPKTVQQAEEHVLFLDAYMRFIKKLRKPLVFHILSEKGLVDKFSKKDAAISEFKKLILGLGLSWKTYKKYVKNYYLRKEYGTLMRSNEDGPDSADEERVCRVSDEDRGMCTTAATPVDPEEPPESQGYTATPIVTSLKHNWRHPIW